MGKYSMSINYLKCILTSCVPDSEPSYMMMYEHHLAVPVAMAIHSLVISVICNLCAHLCPNQGWSAHRCAHLLHHSPTLHLHTANTTQLNNFFQLVFGEMDVYPLLSQSALPYKWSGLKTLHHLGTTSLHLQQRGGILAYSRGGMFLVCTLSPQPFS